MKTRQTILYAAAEVFDEFGYSGSSMRQIMMRAGVTLGAVYFHFANKEALAKEVMNAQQDSNIPRLTSDVLQRLVDLTLVWSRQLQTDPLLRAGVRLTGEQSSFGLHDVTPYQEWGKTMEECLIAAREAGELREHVSPHQIAEFVVGACTGMQMYSDLLNKRADLSKRAIDMWLLLLPGIVNESFHDSIEVSLERADALVG
ncbi:ScbR family autoregulator-binding transcription factor [Streptomyces decoyicus]